MNPATASLIARMQARPNRLRVQTTFVDGSTRHHDVATMGQAENYATGERRKIGRDLINRETGATVRVVSVDILPL
jgi:hypothetical protein